MRTRDATPADAATVSAIGTAEFARTHQPLLGRSATSAIVEQTYSPESVEASIAQCASTDDAHFIVAEREGRVVGYLHYDRFGPEPELRRIYLARDEIGRGTGTRLMEELHARLGAEETYILMVAVDNEGARRFYARHGLVEEQRIPDGNAFYRDHMGVELPPDAPPVPSLILRRGRLREPS